MPRKLGNLPLAGASGCVSGSILHSAPSGRTSQQRRVYIDVKLST